MIAIESTKRISLQNILVATDFSQASDAALRQALGIARRYDSRVYVAHVIRPDSYQMVPPDAMDAAAQQTKRFAEEQMAQLLVSGCLRKIPHQVLLDRGELWPAIEAMIERHGIDLVVAGTHGRTGVRKLLLGSAAEEIFRMVHRPVLTVGPKVPAEAPFMNDYRHILYATDFSSQTDVATAYAVSLAQEHQAHLTLLHVVKAPGHFSPQNRLRLSEMFTMKLQQLVPEEATPWCEPEFRVTFGVPSEEILRTATDSGADLIVLGVRRSATFPGHLPPATAYAVVCRSRCPVLTVRD